MITFINKSGFIQAHLPEPASKAIPNWYKDAASYLDGAKKQTKSSVIVNKMLESLQTNATIKKCIPVFDSMSIGYILKVPDNIEVYRIKQDGEEVTAFSWNKMGPIETHPLEQVQDYPRNEIHKKGLPKFISPWIIKTDPGYSCLFLPPMHREAKFSILPAVVDTDTFDFAINFPFTLTDPDFEGTIEGGTPMVQVIPFKRDEFTHEIYDAYDYVQKYPDTTLFQKEFPDSYRDESWNRKSYR
jgi:hypothetical protein